MTDKHPLLFIRYLKCPEDTAKCFDSEGFFKTGDLAIRQNGRYIFKGRANMDSQRQPLFLNRFIRKACTDNIH